MLLAIGELARRTGLTVKAVRFYADRGLVPPTSRDPNGHRLFPEDAIVRLGLVRTLRDLGVDLPTIREILHRQVALADLATTHADALEARIRSLRRHQAVLRLTAKHHLTPTELSLVHKLATLSETERHHLVADFLATTLPDVDPGIHRSLTPELPADPTTAQLEAWLELADLTQDLDFRSTLRKLATNHSEDAKPLQRDLVATIRDETAHALATGLDPTSAEAAEVVSTVIAHYAKATGHPDDLQHRLADRLRTACDPRRERYQELLATINNWPEPHSTIPALTWFTTALQAQAA
ncbi:MerR family transcriptional regulator [Umezawaea tangerina]|uniref:DNA-binding transcriptional MerR regulator n=1 Tax=Umezawaea tangerina TaxID=84725 RepID=A0A2T0TJR2_9PSEU|nr:MerR family transcriptional regulator [Umezawaea tangerina]PRY45903.1 DNA-binding transcriptional MerR regulator [Umezawaea tangerina]